MNHGEAKDAIFGMIRSLARARGATATIFAVEAWFGKQTDKGRALPPKEFRQRTRERAFETAVRDGLVERSEAIVVTVQTPTHVMMVHQEFERDEKRRRIHYGERHESIGPTESFVGRQKMFGDMREENLS